MRSARFFFLASVTVLALGLAGRARAGAPIIAIEFEGPFQEGAPIPLTAEVTDEDPVTFSWDLDDDGVFGEMPDLAMVTIPAGTTDGPTSVRVGVQATDGTSIQERYVVIPVSNVAPEVTSTAPSVTSVGSAFAYAIEVSDPGGALDPLTFEIVAAPDRLTVSDTGTISWTPRDMDVSMPGDSHRVEIRIEDGDGGEVVHAFDLVVLANRIPVGGSAIYPAEGTGILERMPRLVLGNASDPDRDPLGYYFQIDRVETFDSPDLVESPRVEQTPGFTFWYVPEPLEIGRYYWRGWAHDGTSEGERFGAMFFVVPDSGGADAGTGGGDGGGGGSDAGMTPPEKDDGGCSVATGASSGAVAWGTLAALGLALGRRRRR